MALVVATLKASLVTWLTNASTYLSNYDSMEVFCNAYETYALAATDISGDTPLLTFKSNMLPSEKNIYYAYSLLSMLQLTCPVDSVAARGDNYKCYKLTALPTSNIANWEEITNPVLDVLNGNETSISSSAKFENALIAFWLAATFKLVTPPAGTIAPELIAGVTTNIIKGQLAIDLKAIFDDLSPTATIDQKATQISTALDTATKTIIVTCVGTLATPPYFLAVPGAIV